MGTGGAQPAGSPPAPLGAVGVALTGAPRAPAAPDGPGGPDSPWKREDGEVGALVASPRGAPWGRLGAAVGLARLSPSRRWGQRGQGGRWDRSDPTGERKMRTWPPHQHPRVAALTVSPSHLRVRRPSLELPRDPSHRRLPAGRDGGAVSRAPTPLGTPPGTPPGSPPGRVTYPVTLGAGDASCSSLSGHSLQPWGSLGAVGAGRAGCTLERSRIGVIGVLTAARIRGGGTEPPPSGSPPHPPWVRRCLACRGARGDPAALVRRGSRAHRGSRVRPGVGGGQR